MWSAVGVGENGNNISSIHEIFGEVKIEEIIAYQKLSDRLVL